METKMIISKTHRNVRTENGKIRLRRRQKYFEIFVNRNYIDYGLWAWSSYKH